jgi:hypothetical protein
VGVERGWRVPPPDPADLIRWPGDWGTRFIVLVDVEEEFDWRAPFDRANRSTEAMRAFPEAHRRFREAGVALGCMVDHPIATDRRAVAILGDVVADRRSEIGAQLHGWVNPPFEEEVGPLTSFQANLPPALEAAKLDRLIDTVEGAWGRRPRAFRAGRYGIGPGSRALLAARGVRLDASVRAFHDYAREGGPDFSRVGNAAYRVDGLIELPSTTVFTGVARRGGMALHRLAGRVPRGRGVLARSGLLARMPLTPEGVGAGHAIAAMDRALANGERLLSFSFHSPSLEPGHTPYVRDAAGLRRFWAWWDAVLAHLARRGVANASMGEVVAAAEKG